MIPGLVRTGSLRTLAVSCLLTVVPLVVFLRGDLATRELVLTLAGTVLLVYLATVHPISIFVALAAVLGFVPYLDVPGTTIPMLLVLALGVWVALLFLPGVRFEPGWCEVWVVLLALAALLSVAMTGLSRASLTELVAWLVATAVVIPVRFLPPEARTTMARTFVFACAAAAALGIALVRFDRSGLFLDRLTFAGYAPGKSNINQFPGETSMIVRLTSTYVEPNIAGLILAVGVVLAVAYFRGSLRVVLVVLIGVGLLLTLSRSAIATIAVAGVLFALRSAGSRRAVTVAVGLAGALAALALPVVRTRVLESFGPSDIGSLDRMTALQEFPRLMEDHWVWGLGWARPEFRDAGLNRAVNFVANAPLLTIYRGGLIVGALVVLVLIILVVRSWVAARRSFADAVVCCSVAAFVLVALQLDFPVVLQPPATVVMSMLVGLSLHRDDARVRGSTLAARTTSPRREARHDGDRS